MHQQAERVGAPETPGITDAPERPADRGDDAHPPRARPLLRIGVTGHRPQRLEGGGTPALHARVRDVLRRIDEAARAAAGRAGDAYAGGLRLRVVSPLAEGADRTIAHEAIDLGFELHCPLPFDRDAYERDFDTPQSRREYRDLLGRAGAVLELDGARDTAEGADAAYQAVGRLVLGQSDILVAVWDGDEANGRGGTEQMVREALERGLLTIWIRARAPHEACLLDRGAAGGHVESGLDALPERVAALLLPPAASAADEAAYIGHDLRAAYFAERAPRWSPIGWIWRVFRDAIAAGRPRLPRFRAPDVRAAGAEWDAAWRPGHGLPASATGRVDAAVRRHYAWADRLAEHYANTYRSSFVLNYLLGVVVILLELIVDVSGWLHGRSTLERAFQLAAVGTILLIFVVWALGRRRHWHERWIDFRLLAESLRLFRYTALLGQAPSAAALPAHRSFGDPRNTWMTWLLRAVVRETGLVDAAFTPAYREGLRSLLREGLLGGQIAYHRENAHRLERLAHRLALGGMATFAGALLILLAIVALELHLGWLAMIAVVLPALGGALAAIRGQGELERVARRSRAIARQYEHLRDELDALPSPPPSRALGQTAGTIANTAISEVLDWRIVFQERPLELSG